MPGLVSVGGKKYCVSIEYMPSGCLLPHKQLRIVKFVFSCSFNTRKVIKLIQITRINCSPKTRNTIVISKKHRGSYFSREKGDHLKSADDKGNRNLVDALKQSSVIRKIFQTILPKLTSNFVRYLFRRDSQIFRIL